MMTLSNAMVRLMTIAAAITTAVGCDADAGDLEPLEVSPRFLGGPGGLTGPNKLNTSFLGDDEDYPLDNLPLVAGSDPEVSIMGITAHRCMDITGAELVGNFSTKAFGPVHLDLSAQGVLGPIQMTRTTDASEVCTVSGDYWRDTWWEVSSGVGVKAIQTDMWLRNVDLDEHGSTVYAWYVNYDRVSGSQLSTPPDYRPLCDENDELPAYSGLAYSAYLMPGLRLDSGADFQVTAPAETMFVACRSGAVGKTASWGYPSWTHGIGVHELATRAARADYCGTGMSNTTPGTPIWLSDTIGQWPDEPEEGYVVEAVWSESDGRALCVGEPRLPTVVADPFNCSLFSLPSCDQLPPAIPGNGYITTWVSTS